MTIGYLDDSMIKDIWQLLGHVRCWQPAFWSGCSLGVALHSRLVTLTPRPRSTLTPGYFLTLVEGRLIAWNETGKGGMFVLSEL
jgi:hypothetical protein